MAIPDSTVAQVEYLLDSAKYLRNLSDRIRKIPAVNHVDESDSDSLSNLSEQLIEHAVSFYSGLPDSNSTLKELKELSKNYPDGVEKETYEIRKLLVEHKIMKE